MRHVRLTGPADTGAAVDTRSNKPVAGDKIGANAVAISLLPRTALLVIGRDASVGGIRPDEKLGEHVNAWMKTQRPASRKAIFRLAEALDAGPLAGRWFQPIREILPPDERAPDGALWRAVPPPIETPAGRLAATIDLALRREGDVAVIEGSGSFVLDGAAPEKRPVDFGTGTLAMTAKIDVVRGVITSYEESGEFEFRPRETGRDPARWKHHRTLRLVE